MKLVEQKWKICGLKTISREHVLHILNRLTDFPFLSNIIYIVFRSNIVSNHQSCFKIFLNF